MRLINFLGRAMGVTMFILAGIFTAHAAEAPKSPAAALSAAALEADGATRAPSFVASDRKIHLAQAKKYKGKGKRRARRKKGKIGKGAAAAAVLLGLAASSASKADEAEDDDYEDDYDRGPSCGQLQYRCDNGSDWACRKYDRSC